MKLPAPLIRRDARRQLVEGTVKVVILIGEDGNVISAIAKSGPELLYGASQEAAYKAHFKPTIVNGKPAEVSAAMAYNFVIAK